MMGFKSFVTAKAVLAGIELMHLIRMGQVTMREADQMSAVEQFYALERLRALRERCLPPS